MPNRFEVDEDDCIGCLLCSERAPSNLTIPTGSSVAQVFKQPESPEEEEACLEAAEYCPTGGLRARANAAAPVDSSPHPSSTPAGDATPADAALKLEN